MDNDDADNILLPRYEENLIRTALILEMAKADGFTDFERFASGEVNSIAYNHYIKCFMRVFRRLIKHGNITVRLTPTI